VVGSPGLTGTSAIVPDPDLPTGIDGSRFFYDDAPYPTAAAFIDNGGLLFENTSGFINIYVVAGQYLAGYSELPASDDVVTAVAGLSVPEPVSLSTFAVGALGVLGDRRRLRIAMPSRAAGV